MATGTSTLSDEPVLYAKIQFEFASVKLMDPPDQLLQLESIIKLVMAMADDMRQRTSNVGGNHAV